MAKEKCNLKFILSYYFRSRMTLKKIQELVPTAKDTRDISQH